MMLERQSHRQQDCLEKISALASKANSMREPEQVRNYFILSFMFEWSCNLIVNDFILFLLVMDNYQYRDEREMRKYERQRSPDIRDFTKLNKLVL